MANEIQATASLTCSKSGQTITGNVTQTNSLAGIGEWTSTQNIGTTTVQLSFPSTLTTEGITYLWLYNSDATNYVQIGLDTPVTQIFAKLLPGGVCLLPVYQGNPSYYAKANTAAINLRMVAVGT
jgi:hypothetical protein